MAEASKKDFLSDETERKIAEFEEKLKAQQAAMPDTSIRGGAGGINVLENYYFRESDIPIYDSGTNKQIDRIDMKVDRLKRSKRDARVEAEIEMYMHQIHEELDAKDKGIDVDARKNGKGETAAFIYAVPILLVLFGIVMVLVMNLG